MPVWVDTPVEYWDGTTWQTTTPQYWDGASWQPSLVQIYGSAPTDVSPPVVGFSSPSAGATISSTQTISGTYSDDVEVSTVLLAINGQAVGAATLDAGVWSLPINTTQFPNGLITITATAYDTSGNAASVNRNFNVNNTIAEQPDYTGPYVEPIYTSATTSSVTGTLILPTDAKLSYGGVDSMTDPGTWPGFYRPPFIVGTTATIPPYVLRFNFSGQVFEIYLKTHMSGEEIRIGVNGKWRAQSTTAGYKATTGSGVNSYIKIDFGSSASRTIEVDLRTWFGGIKVANTAQVTRAAALNFRVVGLMDSLGGGTNQGSGDNSTYCTAISTFFPQMCQYLGWLDRYGEGIGGSGFYTNGDGGSTGTYPARVQAAVNARNPDAVFFSAHMLNDYQAGRTPTQLATAFTTCLSAMRAALPNANIICTLTPLPPAISNALGVSAGIALVKSYNDPMLPIADQYGAYVINPLDGNVYDVDGSLIGNPFGGRWQMPDASSTYMTTDGVHPTREGSWVLANQYAAAIQAIFNKSSWIGAHGEVSLSDTAAPSVPVLQTPIATSTSVTLNWVAATDNIATAGYNVYRSGVKQNSSLVTDTYFTQSGLTASTTYGPYTVTAVDTSGNESSPSNPQSVMTDTPAVDTVPPTVPTNLQLTPTNGGFQANWNPSTDLVGVSGYNVYINNVIVASTTLTSYTASGLVNGSVYSVKISAFDAAGNTSSPTSTVTVTPTATTTTLFPPTGLAVVPGNGQLRITWTPPTSGTVPLGYNIYLGGTKYQEERVPSTIIDGLTNNTTYAVQVSSFDTSGNISARTTTVSDTPQLPAGAVEVASYGPNGTHYPDRTPFIFATNIPTVVECDCTWAAIKAAINGLTDAQVNNLAAVKVRPGVLPGSGGGSGNASMLDSVGKAAWRKRVLLTPRDGIGTVTFSNSVRVSKVYNVAFVGFDHRPYGITFTGCPYSAHAWSKTRSWRILGLGGTNTSTGASSGIITEGFDSVEVVIQDVVVGDSDPAGFGAGSPGPAGTPEGNGWLRYCKVIGGYIAPQYLPVDTFDDAGNQLTGFGHNDSCQLYGSSIYYGFIFRDIAFWGSNNSSLQIGGWPGTGDTVVGPIPYFMKLSNVLLPNASVGSATRYPMPPGTKPLTVANCINGIGRNGQHYSDRAYTAGSLYSTTWSQVSNSYCTVSPPPSVVGAWDPGHFYPDVDSKHLESDVSGSG